MGAGSVTTGYTSGTFWQGFGAFFDPIVEQFGWSRATTSAAISLQRTESGMVSPFVGYFIDRFGPRKVMLVGILMTGAGFILLARINSLWQFYSAFALITLGMSVGTWMVVTTAVANWFVALRTRALALTSAGSALGGLLVPVVIWLIATTDWRTALVLIGVGFWIIGIPSAIVMRRRPEDHGLLPDGRSDETFAKSGAEAPAGAAHERAEASFSVRQALRTRTFWQMALAMGAGQLVMSASVHQIPAVTSFGFSREAAGVVMLAVSLMSLAGRIVSGFAGDRVDKRKVIAAAFALQLVGTLIFAYHEHAALHLVGFVVCWGIGFGVLDSGQVRPAGRLLRTESLRVGDGNHDDRKRRVRDRGAGLRRLDVRRARQLPRSVHHPGADRPGGDSAGPEPDEAGPREGSTCLVQRPCQTYVFRFQGREPASQSSPVRTGEEESPSAPPTLSAARTVTVRREACAG